MKQNEDDEACFTLHEGDARASLELFRKLGLGPDPFLTTTITSPPYAHLKDYNAKGQIGWAQEFNEYLQDCGDVFADIFDCTLSHGSLWLIADTLRRPNKGSAWRLEPLPFLLADQAEKAGWMLRDVVIWRKDRTLPWSSHGRLRNAFEYVLHLVKSENFKYHIDRLRDPSDLAEWWVRFPERYNPLGPAPTNVWDVRIPKQGAWGRNAPRHSCPLPPELVDRMILLSSDPGDVVFDPFAGIGTVVDRASVLERRGIGLELNSTFIDTFRARGNTARPGLPPQSEDLALTIRRLRALKFARVLADMYFTTSQGPDREALQAMIVIANPKPGDDLSNTQELVSASLYGVVSSSGDGNALRENLQELSGRRPLSKFGVAAKVDLITPGAVHDVTGRRRLYLYPHARFWRTVGLRSAKRALEVPTELGTPRRPVILSNLAVNVEPPRDADYLQVKDG